MLTLTAAISVPNIQKIHVDAVQLDSNLNVATVTCSVQGSGGVVYGLYTLTIQDGKAQGLQANGSPLGYGDRVQTFTTTTGVATAFTDLVTAYTGNITARNKAAESALLAAGLLPAGTVA